jgi:oligopeptide transport system permease protein
MNEIEYRPSKTDFEVVGANIEASQVIVRKSMTYWQDAWRRLKQSKASMICLIYLILLIIGAIVFPMVSGFTGSEIHSSETYLPPFSMCTDTTYGTQGHMHWFGTDSIGRDVFTRIWLGAQISLFIGFMAALTEFLIGLPYGGISGYLGKWVDNLMMRVLEIVIGIPYLIIIILLLVVMEPGLWTIVLALAIVGWTGLARLVRGQVVQLKEQEFVMAAKVLGAKAPRIVMNHMFPNTIGIVVVALTLAVPGAIFTEAFLSFIGLGVAIPTPSWGMLASDGIREIRQYPYLLFIPAAFISLTMLALNILGDKLRDVLDPRLRR